MPPIPRALIRTEVQTFYHFTTLSKDDVQRIESGLHALGKSADVTALIILGSEGMNATAAGEPHAVSDFVKRAAFLLEPGFEFQNIKKSHIDVGEKLPFLDFVVKIRKEIVTLGRTDLAPKEMRTPSHLSPADWREQIQSPDAVVIDTRNAYESSIGTFRNALTPEIEEFSEFPKWLDDKIAADEVDKSKPTYIFCTGGIRCEKAILAMEEKGFGKVFQLDGGILNYIETFPQSPLWEGECFVFDHRIAVDDEGKASRKFSACPHCGQPAEHQIFCVRCDSPAVMCDECYNKQSTANGCTCSKNCAHHWTVRPGQKGRPQRQEDLKPKQAKSF